MLIDVLIEGKTVSVLFIPPAVIEEEITVIVLLLVVVKVQINGGLTGERKAQSRQSLIPFIVPVASTGGIIIIEVTHSEKASVIKEEKVLGYPNQIIDTIPVGTVVGDAVVKVFILKTIL